MDLAHCSTSAGMPSPPGALPCERVDGFAQLFLCWWCVELLHNWQAGDAVEGRLFDHALSQVKVLIVLCPSVHLLAAICDGLTGGLLQRGCFPCTRS